VKLKSKNWPRLCLAALSGFVALLAVPARANPMLPPTADYIADVEITRDSDHAVRTPARYVVAGRKLSVSYNSLVTLVDLDRKQFFIMIPRVKVYAKAQAIKGAAEDSRRWTGVDAQKADYLATEKMLDRDVRKYRVVGKVFDTDMPFEGDVWTTAENIVVKIDGTSQVGNLQTPLQVTTLQLVVGPVDPALVNVPPNFRRAAAGEVYSEDDK
jgi:hypothetical protein